MGGWVGYRLHWIRQRHAVLHSFEVPERWSDRHSTGEVSRDLPPPWQLALFGEKSAGRPVILLRETVTDEQLIHAQSMFPEAQVRRITIREMLDRLIE